MLEEVDHAHFLLRIWIRHFGELQREILDLKIFEKRADVLILEVALLIDERVDLLGLVDAVVLGDCLVDLVDHRACVGV